MKAELDLTHRLQELNQELAGVASNSSKDLIDQSIESQSEQLKHSLQKKLLRDLAEVRHSLEKMKSGVYGICERTGDPIEEVRLRLIPWTRYSREGAALSEEDASSVEEGPHSGWSSDREEELLNESGQ